MKTKILLVTVITAFAFNCFAGDKKGSETIKPPKYVSLNEFLPIWISSQAKIKYDRNLVKVKQDDTFYYFSYAWLPEQPLYKVRTSELSKIDFDHLDIVGIHAQFQEKVVPAEDKRRFECQGYTAAIEGGGYNYRYLEEKKAIEINYILKAHCDFIVKAINKSYTAEYYFDTGELIKTDEHDVKKK